MGFTLVPALKSKYILYMYAHMHCTCMHTCIVFRAGQKLAIDEITLIMVTCIHSLVLTSRLLRCCVSYTFYFEVSIRIHIRSH